MSEDEHLIRLSRAIAALASDKSIAVQRRINILAATRSMINGTVRSLEQERGKHHEQAEQPGNNPA